MGSLLHRSEDWPWLPPRVPEQRLAKVPVHRHVLHAPALHADRQPPVETIGGIAVERVGDVPPVEPAPEPEPIAEANAAPSLVLSNSGDPSTAAPGGGEPG